MATLICKICSIPFLARKSRAGISKYCSMKCYGESKKGIFVRNSSHFSKGKPSWNKGTKGVMKAWNKGKRKYTINCLTCGKISKSMYQQSYCNRNCFFKANTGIRHHLFGKKFYAVMGDKNVNWKGDEVSYRSLHKWVERKLGKSDICEECGKSELKGRQIHWANINGLYKRVTTDWRRLCAKCHGKFDTLNGLRPRKSGLILQL